MSALTSTELMHASLELVKVATKLRRETSHIMTTPAAAGIGTHPTHTHTPMREPNNSCASHRCATTMLPLNSMVLRLSSDGR